MLLRGVELRNWLGEWGLASEFVGTIWMSKFPLRIVKENGLFIEMDTWFVRMRQRVMGCFFELLYHSFSWAYDGVAALVSFGQWQTWGRAVLPFVTGRRILELGYGSGDLQAALGEAGFEAFGVDESWQMARRAARRVDHRRLLRGRGEALPFEAKAFDCVLATFPAPYLFEESTLLEIRRVLRCEGRLVILPAAWIEGTGIKRRLLAWVYRVTGESPEFNPSLLREIEVRLTQAGFCVAIQWVDVAGARLMIVQGDGNHFFME